MEDFIKNMSDQLESFKEEIIGYREERERIDGRIESLENCVSILEKAIVAQKKVMELELENE